MESLHTGTFEEQKDFVAENIQSLAEAYATRNRGGNALPLAVYNDETLVGFYHDRQRAPSATKKKVN